MQMTGRKVFTVAAFAVILLFIWTGVLGRIWFCRRILEKGSVHYIKVKLTGTPFEGKYFFAGVPGYLSGDCRDDGIAYVGLRRRRDGFSVFTNSASKRPSGDALRVRAVEALSWIKIDFPWQEFYYPAVADTGTQQRLKLASDSGKLFIKLRVFADSAVVEGVGIGELPTGHEQ